jgi:WD40 repeat protein
MRKLLAAPMLSSLLVAQPSPELVVSVGHSAAPTHAAFVGPYLATAAWSNVALIRLSSGLTEAHLPQGSHIMAIEASPAGDRLAVGTCGHSILLWDVHSRTLVRRIAIEQECAESLSFSPDGTLLATGGYGCCPGKGLQIWDVRTGSLVQVLAGAARIRHVLFSPNGQWVAGVDDKGRASLFDWPSGRELRTFGVFVESGYSSSAIIASHDGKYFARFGMGTNLRVWDVVSGGEVAPLTRRLDGLQASTSPENGWTKDHFFTVAEFLDDGRLAYVDGNHVVLTRLPDGPQERKPLPEHEKEFSETWGFGQPPFWLRIRKDGSLITGSHETRTILWDVVEKRFVEPKAPALVSPTSLQWNRSGLIVWADRQSGARGWDDRRGKLVDFGGEVEVIDAIALSPDGERLAVAGFSSISIVDVARRRTIASFDSAPSAGTAVAFSPDGSQLAFGLPARGFGLFDGKLRPQGLIAALEGHMSVEHVAFSPDGRWIATGLGGPRPMIRVWSAPGFKDAVTLDSNEVTYGPQPPAFSSDSKWLSSFRRGRSLTIWSTASWEVARAWTLPGTGNALSFSPLGSRLAVASEGGAAIWDADTGSKLVSFSTPGSVEMEQIAWSPDGKRVVTSADDGVLRFWSSDDGQLLASLYVLDSGRDWLLVAPDNRLDGNETALSQLVAWRLGERVTSDRSLTEEHRVRGLWRSLSN